MEQLSFYIYYYLRLELSPGRSFKTHLHSKLTSLLNNAELTFWFPMFLPTEMFSSAVHKSEECLTCISSITFNHSLLFVVTLIIWMNFNCLALSDINNDTKHTHTIITTLPPQNRPPTASGKKR